MGFKAVRFANDSRAEFYNVLRERVKEFFESNKISPYANARMVLKTITMLTIYCVPLGVLYFGSFNSVPVMMACWVVMGFGMAGIGMSVMHDANHGSYSKKESVNKYVGLLINLVGGCAVCWKIQHNLLHHSFTNVEGFDDDIDSGPILRFSPHQPVKKAHKYQHIYAWFLYSLMTLMWITSKDFKQLKDYDRRGLLKTHVRKTFTELLFRLIGVKVFYYIVTLVLPLMLLPFSWPIIVVGFVLMHMLAGLTLSTIFQSAHVMPESDYKLPDENGKMDANWALHQLANTTNFAPKSKFLTWYLGGLNFQIEHHLFQHISHVYYSRLSKIVEQTAKEFGVPYNVEPTFVKAVSSHAKMLKALGRGEF
jgi:linoleoyl-CoA desaturase